jgi:hypothetical protein
MKARLTLKILLVILIICGLELIGMIMTEVWQDSTEQTGLFGL